MTLYLLGLFALGLLAILAFKPDFATALVLFVVYTNAAVVGYKYHAVPYFAAAGVTLLLLLPLGYYVAIQRQQVRWNPVLIPLYLLLCVQLLSALFGPFRDRAFPATLDFAIEGLVLYFLVNNALRDEESVRKGVWALLAAGGAMSALVLFQAVTGTLDNDYWGFAQTGGLFYGSAGTAQLRHAGPIGEQNNFALILVVLIPLGWFMIYYARTHINRLIALLVTILIAIGVMLTYSRAAGAVMLLMIPAMAYITRTKLLYLIGGGIAALMLVTAMNPDYVARLASLDEIQELFAGDSLAVDDQSLTGRASENLAAISMFYDHPFFGVGETNYTPLYADYAREFSLDDRIERRPHNLYLGVLAEGGIFGFLAMMLVFAASLLQLWMARKRSLRMGDEVGAALCGLLIISIMGRLVNGIFLDLTYERYLWLLLAVGGAAASMRIPNQNVIAGASELPQTATYAPPFPPSAGD